MTSSPSICQALSRREFESACRMVASSLECQGLDYLQDHWLRLYATYEVGCGLLAGLGRAARVLSVGGGSAYVETQLARTFPLEITVVDFPEMIARQQGHYAQQGFLSHAADLTRGVTGLPQTTYDLVMSCEIVEHLPLSPFRHFQALAPLLVPGGNLLVTTPNLANLWSLIRLWRGQPLAPDPDLVFGPVDFQHEAVHRREYVAAEILEALARNQLRTGPVRYVWNTYRTYPGARSLLSRSAEALVTHWRPIMIVTGQRSTDVGG